MKQEVLIFPALVLPALPRTNAHPPNERAGSDGVYYILQSCGHGLAELLKI